MGQLLEMDDKTWSEIFKQLIDNMADWMIIGDETGQIIYANHAVLRDCQMNMEEITGRDICLVVGTDLTDELTLSHIRDFVKNKQDFNFITTRFIRHEERVYLANQLFSIQDKKGTEYTICVSKDITNTQRLKEEIYKANYFDSLTNYPNYKFFLESLEREIQRCRKCKGHFAVLLVEIKGLGEINNTYSVSAGEQLISRIGKRINEVIKIKQEVFKYKWNVFAIIFRDYGLKREIEDFVNLLSDRITQPVKIHNRELKAAVSTGIAVYPEHAIETRRLIEMAQLALSHARHHSGRRYTFYSRDIQEVADENARQEAELQRAVEKDEFIVYYQPFVDLKEDRLVGMEALVRRRGKNGEVIPPGQFIERLEQMHLIEKVGMIVLDKVCQKLRKWLDKGYQVVPVSVNLSAVQFRNPNLAEEIRATLHRYSIPTRYIVLEITESTVMEDIKVANRSICQLKEDGFAISMDDFGTGYASIGYLKKFMFDHLKIDISFIREIVENKQDRSIVEAIISIAKTLNLTTIAEGIENEEQLYVMSALGCEMGQGYLWDRPIDAEVIESKYLKNSR